MVLLLELIEFILRIIVRLIRKKKNMAKFALAARRISVAKLECVVEDPKDGNEEGNGSTSTVEKGLKLTSLERRIKAAWKK